MKPKETNPREGNKSSQLSEHEREQLRAWMKTTPRQRLAWLEEAQQLVAAAKNKQPNH